MGVNNCHCKPSHNCHPNGNSRANMNPIDLQLTLETPTNFIKGLDGKSAYDYAVEGGFEGTEAEFTQLMAAALGGLRIDATNIVLGRDITVSGTSLGTYKDGTVIEANTPLIDILTNIFIVDVVFPVYDAPSFTATSDLSGPYGIGELVRARFSMSFTQRDAGPLIRYEIALGNDVLYSGSDENVDVEFTAPGGDTVITVTAYYNEGPIKNASNGVPYPSGRIESGSLEKQFELGSNADIYATSELMKIDIDEDPNRIFSFNTTLPIELSQTIYRVPISEGSTWVCIVYPSSMGELYSIVQRSIGFNIMSSFHFRTITLLGMDFYVYEYESLDGLDADEYTLNFE